MDLPELQRHWDAFGRHDPYWAILAHPAHRGNRWPLDEFFDTGRREIAAVMAHAARLGVPAQRRRALDFGCGAGRLTQALAGQFESALGLDVAPSMIALARQHNQHGDRCVYEVNDRPDLSRWSDGSFDLVYTGRVLQHVEPRFSTAYVADFVRVLAPGGYLSFDLPSEAGDAAAEAGGTVPPSSMRARIDIDDPRAAALTLPSGRTAAVQVTITNLSDRPWHSTPAHVINLGNHWVDPNGAVVAYDDGRTPLPAVLGPGDTVQAELVVTAPGRPGTYRLQIDVVQEGVAWFATCGSTLAEITARVGDPVSEPTREAPEADRQQGAQADAPAPFEPVMEMHAVPRAQVETILADAGARVLDVRPVHHCGPLWTAYRYDVTR